MGRIFSFISLIVILMTALTGAGVFYLSQNSDQQIKEEAINGLVKDIAQSISTRTQLLSESLRNIAQSAELVEALTQSDLPRAKEIVQLMSAYLPDAIAFRLLLAANNKPDNSVIPHMGYADLDLVKNTFKQPQFPLIQGEQGEHRHFYGIEQSDRVIAVILASVDFQDLQKNFKILGDEQLYIELKQADVVLFSHGQANIKSSTSPNSFAENQGNGAIAK